MRYEKSHAFHNLLMQLLVAAFLFTGLLLVDHTFRSNFSDDQSKTQTYASIAQ